MLPKLLTSVSKKSFTQVGMYTATAAITKVISFVFLPFFVNTLSEGDVGILNIFGSTIVFLTPVLSMGVLYTISVDFFKVSKEEYPLVFSSSLFVPVLFSIVMLPLLYLFFPVLSRTFSFQQNFIWLIPACVLLNFFFEVFITLLRLSRNVNYFAIISTLKVVLEIGIAVLLVKFFAETWYSRALGYFVSGIIIAFFFLFYVIRQRYLVAKVSAAVIKKELLFGLAGLLLQVSIFFNTTSDKFFVMAFFGKEQVGLYSVAATFAAIQYIVSSSLIQYLQPILFKKFSENAGWSAVKSIYYKFIVAMLAVWGFVMIGTYIAYHFFLKASYVNSIHYFYMLSVGALIWPVTNIFLQSIIYFKKKKVLAAISISTIIVSASVNFIACRYLDIVWLCVGQIAINIIVLLVTLYFNKQQGDFRN